MKCKKCDRPATFHITELTDSQPMELHLCEAHANEYLNNAAEGSGEANSSNLAASLAHNMAQQLSLTQASDELKEIDQKMCPICGITFFEFRSRGRLGCPNDYTFFEEQLEPLVLSIHGESQHIGKTPKRLGKGDDQRIRLIQLRRELDDAITKEDYELASQLRDEIKSLS